MLCGVLSCTMCPEQFISFSCTLSFSFVFHFTHRAAENFVWKFTLKYWVIIFAFALYSGFWNVQALAAGNAARDKAERVELKWWLNVTKSHSSSIHRDLIPINWNHSYRSSSNRDAKRSQLIELVLKLKVTLGTCASGIYSDLFSA